MTSSRASASPRPEVGALGLVSHDRRDRDASGMRSSVVHAGAGSDLHRLRRLQPTHARSGGEPVVGACARCERVHGEPGLRRRVPDQRPHVSRRDDWQRRKRRQRGGAFRVDQQGGVGRRARRRCPGPCRRLSGEGRHHPLGRPRRVRRLQGRGRGVGRGPEVGELELELGRGLHAHQGGLCRAERLRGAPLALVRDRRLRLAPRLRPELHHRRHGRLGRLFSAIRTTSACAATSCAAPARRLGP